MSAAQLVALRFGELIGTGKFSDLDNYMSDDVVISTWNGVVYGKEKAHIFFEDYRRYMHHSQNFDKWKQVHHSLDPSLLTFDSDDVTQISAEDRVHRSRRIVSGRVAGGDMTVAKYFDADGYDSQGFAMFERNGTYGSHPKFAFARLPVRQVIVVSRGAVVLYQLSMRS